jgi:hypothetical protein
MKAYNPGMTRRTVTLVCAALSVMAVGAWRVDTAAVPKIRDEGANQVIYHAATRTEPIPSPIRK